MPSAALVAVFLLPLVVSLLVGGPLIARLKRLKAGQRVRDDGPQRHLTKEGTPTMGGMMIVGAMLVGLVVGAAAVGRSAQAWFLAAGGVATVAFGAIGFADDYAKIRRGRSLGLKARQKLALQFLGAAAVIGAVIPARNAAAQAELSLGAALLWVLALVGTSNAVNLADGLDGLAGGLCTVAALGFAAIGLLQHQPAVVVMALALAGACLGFLWFNRHPARLFMGDVGSLALGAALATMALLLPSPAGAPMAWRPLLVLAGLGLIPFLEAASVVIQVISFQTTGKRVFKMSPLHHHFELSGWPERRVVWTFWSVGLAAAIATVQYIRTVAM